MFRYTVLILVSVIHNPWPGLLHFIDPLHPCILSDICNHTWLPECGHYAKTNTLRIFSDECDMFEYNCDNNKNYKLTEYYFCVATHKTCPPVSPCDPYAPGGHLYPGEVIYQTRRRRFFDDGQGKIVVIDRQITKHDRKKLHHKGTQPSQWTTTSKEPHKGRYYRFLKQKEAEEKNIRKNGQRAGMTKPSCGRDCRRNMPPTTERPTLKRPIFKYSPEKPNVIYTKFRTERVLKNGKRMVKIFKKIVKGALGDYDYLEHKK